MSNILIINGAKKFAHSNGQLNDTLTEVADGCCAIWVIRLRSPAPTATMTLKKRCRISSGRGDLADAVLVMGTMTVKKYMDDVPYRRSRHALCQRWPHASDAAKKYGSGGSGCRGKYAVTDVERADGSIYRKKDQFFHGVGVDGVYLPFHKSQPVRHGRATNVYCQRRDCTGCPRYTAEYIASI